MSPGEALRDLRLCYGLSIAQAAKICKISELKYVAIEKDKYPDSVEIVEGILHANAEAEIINQGAAPHSEHEDLSGGDQ